MAPKKTTPKQATRLPLSLVSSALASVLRGSMQAAAPQEQSWREKRKGKRRGKKQ